MYNAHWMIHIIQYIHINIILHTHKYFFLLQGLDHLFSYSWENDSDIEIFLFGSKISTSQLQRHLHREYKTFIFKLDSVTVSLFAFSLLIWLLIRFDNQKQDPKELWLWDELACLIQNQQGWELKNISENYSLVSFHGEKLETYYIVGLYVFWYVYTSCILYIKFICSA